jgi:hypothetical protein
MKISHRSLLMSVHFHGQDKDFLKYCKLLEKYASARQIWENIRKGAETEKKHLEQEKTFFRTINLFNFAVSNI